MCVCEALSSLAFHIGVEAQTQVFMFTKQDSYPKSPLSIPKCTHFFFIILTSLHKFLLQPESLFMIHQFYDFSHENSNQYSFFSIEMIFGAICTKTNSHLVPGKSQLENVLN